MENLLRDPSEVIDSCCIVVFSVNGNGQMDYSLRISNDAHISGQAKL